MSWGNITNKVDLRPVEQIRRVTEELTYIVTSPHSENGETFAFIRRRLLSKQPPFMPRFEGEPVHRNLTKNAEHSSPPDHTTLSRRHAELVADPKTLDFRWAFSKKSGRPHPRDTRELELKEGESVKVIQDEGRDWYIAVNARGTVGWVHGSWIKFADSKVHLATKLRYTRFIEDLEKLLVPGKLQDFPVMESYVDECTRPECSTNKQDASSLGICVHDLQSLLNGSGRFSYEWLKEGRNFWHPDRFARFCHPEAVERLKPMSEQMFVMYGMLMESCRR